MRSWEPQQTKTVLFFLFSFWDKWGGGGHGCGRTLFLPFPPLCFFLSAPPREQPPRREATLTATQSHAQTHWKKAAHAQRLCLGRSRTTRRKATVSGEAKARRRIRDRKEGTTIAFVLTLPGLIETWATANAHRWGMRRAREALGAERQSAARIARSGKERERELEIDMLDRHGALGLRDVWGTSDRGRQACLIARTRVRRFLYITRYKLQQHSPV